VQQFIAEWRNHMNTTVLHASTRPAWLGAAAIGQRIATDSAALLRRLGDWLLTAQPEPTRSARELLALAERYEATMPGFAADLRAAAMSDRGLA
jgi:3'-phosphoadenosine 5'-phosphosulfate sulfotransferase (PAPS reductase)/FAD synthetase